MRTLSRTIQKAVEGIKAQIGNRTATPSDVKVISDKILRCLPFYVRWLVGRKRMQLMVIKAVRLTDPLPQPSK